MKSAKQRSREPEGKKRGDPERGRGRAKRNKHQQQEINDRTRGTHRRRRAGTEWTLSQSLMNDINQNEKEKRSNIIEIGCPVLFPTQC